MTLRGEDIQIPIRLVVASRAGVFRCAVAGPVPAEGLPVDSGETLGIIEFLGGSAPVLSPFCGHLRGMLAESGERVFPNQPLAWIEVPA